MRSASLDEWGESQEVRRLALVPYGEVQPDGSVRYGDVTALDDFSFTLPGGRIYGLLGAGFYRSNGGELVAIALALAMVVATGSAIGFDGLPLLGSVVDLARVPLAGTLALCLAGLLPGVAVTWAMVRDIPIRNRVT